MLRQPKVIIWGETKEKKSVCECVYDKAWCGQSCKKSESSSSVAGSLNI